MEFEEDKLTDTEELAYYRKYYYSRKTITVIVGILCFCIGFIAALILKLFL